mgnify:CR=1 FL=1
MLFIKKIVVHLIFTTIRITLVNVKLKINIMSKIKLVEFKNGMHGVVKIHWLFGDSFLSMRGTGNYYTDPLDVAEYFLNSKPIKYTIPN